MINIEKPLYVYVNWGAFDELSDTVEHTETLAMHQFDELLRLRSLGVRFDAYILDAFWYDPDSGYRAWRSPHWPDGPDRFIARCREHDVIPGLWFTTNVFCHFNSIPAWEDSVSDDGLALCMFHGGFLDHFMESLQIWYDRGFRMFKIDFAKFHAAPAHIRQALSEEEIRARNIAAWRSALAAFRNKNPDTYFLAFNGYGGWQEDTVTPFTKCADPDWFNYFESLYSGDPRPADVPCKYFWRSMDIYSDHMVRYYEYNGYPLKHIDNAAFSVGTTGCVYSRGTQAWKGMLLLSLARGGWMNTQYGNLELLNDQDAGWLVRAQAFWLAIQQNCRIATFGGIPGKSKPYGYIAENTDGAVYTIVNPSQSFQTLALPAGTLYTELLADGTLLFRDDGFVPVLQDGHITLGPEQLVIVGFGKYAAGEYDLGIQEDIVIPVEIHPVEHRILDNTGKDICAEFIPPGNGLIRIVVQQVSKNGVPARTIGGAPPDGISMDQLLTITVQQNGKAIPVSSDYGKQLWCGLSWGCGETDISDLQPGTPVSVQCSTQEKQDVHLEVNIYNVLYK
jgi:hypothetical protein